jgi:hypothetical protein
MLVVRAGRKKKGRSSAQLLIFKKLCPKIKKSFLRHFDKNLIKEIYIGD